jgi:hypothetical protein
MTTDFNYNNQQPPWFGGGYRTQPNAPDGLSESFGGQQTMPPPSQGGFEQPFPSRVPPSGGYQTMPPPTQGNFEQAFGQANPMESGGYQTMPPPRGGMSDSFGGGYQTMPPPQPKAFSQSLGLPNPSGEYQTQPNFSGGGLSDSFGASGGYQTMPPPSSPPQSIGLTSPGGGYQTQGPLRGMVSPRSGALQAPPSWNGNSADSGIARFGAPSPSFAPQRGMMDPRRAMSIQRAQPQRLGEMRPRPTQPMPQRRPLPSQAAAPAQQNRLQAPNAMAGVRMTR